MNARKTILFMTMALATLSVGCNKSSSNVELGDYNNIKVQALRVEPTEEEVQAQIDTFLENKKYVDAENTVIDDGEIVNIDYKGFLDGEAFEGGTAEGYDLKVGSQTILFEEQLIGKNAGETVMLDVTFPEVYHSEALAGKQTQFEVKINHIYSIPELTEEIVVDDGTYASVQELKDGMTEKLKQSKQSTSDGQFLNSVMTTLVSNCKIDNLDKKAVKQYYKDEYNYYLGLVQAYGITLDDFLNANGLTEDEFKEECKKTAVLKVKEDVVIGAIADKENIKLTNDEYNTKLQELATEYGIEDKNTLVKLYGGKEKCKQFMLATKVREFIVDKAEVSEYVDDVNVIIESLKDMVNLDEEDLGDIDDIDNVEGTDNAEDTMALYGDDEED